MIPDLVDSFGILLRRDALARGLWDQHLYRALKTGQLVRLRQGAYVLGEVWSQADEAARHVLLVRAVQQIYGDGVAVSHQSACLLQDGPNWGLDLSTAHLTNMTGIGERRAAKITHHRGVCRVQDLTRIDGHWVTSPARTALDTAHIATRDAAVCVLDWYLNQCLTTREELEFMLADKAVWPHSLGLLITVRLSDGRSESVGETRSRLLMVDHGLPLPVLQHEVRRPDGSLIGRSDFAWPELGVLGEFDGLGKYLRSRRPGESIAEAVLREKRREDEMREVTGWRFVRLDWSDLERPQVTAARLRHVLSARAAA